MPENKVIIYTANDGKTKIDVKLEEETLWLTQAQMCELYQTSKSNVSEHIKHIFEEGELDKEATVRKFRTVQTEGSRNVEREVEHYNLDMIIALGYRVRSLIATRFRQWATERLREYIVKGFTLDDERLKKLGGGSYWKEMPKRISNKPKSLFSNKSAIKSKQLLISCRTSYWYSCCSSYLMLTASLSVLCNQKFF